MLNQRYVLYAFLAIFTMALLIGCNKSVEFTIYFDSNGGSLVSPITTDGKSAIHMLDDPVKDDYDFAGWFWDNNTFSLPFAAISPLHTPLSSNMTVYAKWVRVNEQTSTIPLLSITIPSSEYDEEYIVDGKSEKCKNVTGLVSEANPSYVIHYTIEPHNATTTITVTKDPSSGVVDILHNPDNRTVTVIYNPSVIGKTSGTVTITIKADEQRKDSITLIFGTPSEVQ